MELNVSVLGSYKLPTAGRGIVGLDRLHISQFLQYFSKTLKN